MFPILKIWHKIGVHDFKHIYIFLNNNWNQGCEITLDELQEGIHNHDHTILAKLLQFTEVDIHTIQEQNIPISIIDYPIHIDDTIDTIKRKIIEKTKLQIAFPEIY